MSIVRFLCASFHSLYDKSAGGREDPLLLHHTTHVQAHFNSVIISNSKVITRTYTITHEPNLLPYHKSIVPLTNMKHSKHTAKIHDQNYKFV